MYSVESRVSFDVVKHINDRLLNLLIGSADPVRVLVANKSDIAGRQVTKEEGRALAAEWGCPFVECSAKVPLNVDKVFVQAFEEIAVHEKSERDDGGANGRRGYGGLCASCKPDALCSAPLRPCSPRVSGAAALLALLEDTHAIELLLRLLRDGDARIRANAAGAIANFAAPAEHSVVLQQHLSAQRAAPVLLNLACFGTDDASRRMAVMAIKTFALQHRRRADAPPRPSIAVEKRFVASLLDCGAVEQLRREGWDGVADVLASEALEYDDGTRVESAELSILGRSHNSEV